MGFYLGIDLGTSYLKAGIFDKNGFLLGLGRHALGKKFPVFRGKKAPPVVQDAVGCELPIADFWSTLHKCINQAMEKAKINPNKLLTVSYSSQANSFVLLDETDTPLTSLILWPDERVGRVPSALQTLLKNHDFLKRTGLGISPGVQSMVAKIAWFQENKPGAWKKVSSIASISDYLTLSLTGQKVSDFSTSSMTGLLDVSGERWWNEALETLNISENLLFSPKRTGSFVGPLIGRRAKSLGLSTNTKFFLGGLDHHIVAVGAGLPNSTNLSESTGTVLACVNYRQGFQPKEGINVAPSLKEGDYFQMAFNENGATVLEWYQKKFAPELSIEELLKMAESISPGSDGLKALPCANKYESLSGFYNIVNRHSHGHFVRAILESTALSLRDLVDSLDRENVSKALIASGGGARSLLWVQVKADILNKAFMVPECSELACQGAALIGAMGNIQENNGLKPFERQARYARLIKPNPINVERYKLGNKIIRMKKTEKDVILQRAKQSLEIESKAISDIIDYLDEESFLKAVKVLSSCPKIITCASGSSGIAAKKFAHSLCCIERNAQFLSPAEAIHGGMGCMKKEDAVVMVSRGGKTAELLPIIEVCNKKGVILIGITENLDSPLAKSSQIVIPMKIERESDPLNVMATSSFVATIAIFDAMLAAIMEVTNYTLEQFALIHPGGAVGSRLNRE